MARQTDTKTGQQRVKPPPRVERVEEEVVLASQAQTAASPEAYPELSLVETVSFLDGADATQILAGTGAVLAADDPTTPSGIVDLDESGYGLTDISPSDGPGAEGPAPPRFRCRRWRPV